MPLSLSRIRVISFDVTGTLIRHRDPIMETYAKAMLWSQFPKPLSAEQLAPAFKSAYKKTLLEYPYFGSSEELVSQGKRFSSRQWWVKCVQNVLRDAGLELDKDYSQPEFDRFFRRVYQHYGCPEGYTPMNDAKPFLKWAMQQGYLLGVTTNTPSRTMDSVLPFMGIHHFMRFFCCSQDCGSEKPEKGIFDYSFSHISEVARNIIKNDVVDEVMPWDEVRLSHLSEESVITGAGGSVDIGSEGEVGFPMLNRYQKLKNDSSKDVAIKPEEILHIGDSLAADLCGPMRFGWQGLFLDRSKDLNVRVYQDWLKAPDYTGKNEEDINQRTVTNFGEVRAMLEKCEV